MQSVICDLSNYLLSKSQKLENTETAKIYGLVLLPNIGIHFLVL